MATQIDPDVMAQAVGGMSPQRGQQAINTTMQTLLGKQQLESTHARDLKRLQLREEELEFKKAKTEEARQWKEMTTAIDMALQRRAKEQKERALALEEQAQKLSTDQFNLQKPVLKAEAQKARFEADMWEQLDGEVSTKFGPMPARSALIAEKQGLDVFDSDTYFDFKTVDGKLARINLKTGDATWALGGDNRAFSQEELAEIQEKGGDRIFDYYGVNSLLGYQPEKQPYLTEDLKIFQSIIRKDPRKTYEEAASDALFIGRSQRGVLDDIKDAESRAEAMELAQTFLANSAKYSQYSDTWTAELFDPGSLVEAIRSGDAKDQIDTDPETFVQDNIQAMKSQERPVEEGVSGREPRSQSVEDSSEENSPTEKAAQFRKARRAIKGFLSDVDDSSKADITPLVQKLRDTYGLSDTQIKQELRRVYNNQR